MDDAGRILHHLKHNLWRPESTVLFVGYQAQGSMGRRLLEGIKKVRIMGEEITVKARIANLEGFSAHADKEQLTTWLSNFTSKPANIFVVHGEHQMSEPFAALITDKFNIPTYIPKYGDSVTLTGRSWQIEPSAIIEFEPAVQQLREVLDEMEKEFGQYRSKMEDLVLINGNKLQDVLKRIDKIRKFIKKTLSDLWA